MYCTLASPHGGSRPLASRYSAKLATNTARASRRSVTACIAAILAGGGSVISRDTCGSHVTPPPSDGKQFRVPHVVANDVSPVATEPPEDVRSPSGEDLDRWIY